PGDEDNSEDTGGTGNKEEEKSGKKEGKAEWKKRADELGIHKAGLVADLLWGKIPKKIQEAAGGENRPKYFKWPVPGGRFGRGFGSGKDGKHKALDIVAPQGTPVLAATYGIVAWANTKSGYGKTIIIVHPGGWVTLYAHLSKYYVQPGMRVKARQKIAAVGNTGISRGPHLHFMWFDNGELRDPAPLMHPSIPHLPHVAPMPFMGHTVKKGESPAKIAKKYGVETDALLKANGMMEGQGFLAGWKIIIPKQHKQKTFSKGVYEVKKGDTLSAIAVLYDVSYKELKAINGIKNEDSIKPGMKIKLPDGTYSGKAMNKKDQDSEDKFLESRCAKYKVKDGDNLFLIAKKFDTSISKIVSINNLKNPDFVKPGTVLLVPSKNKIKNSEKKKKKKDKPGKKSKTGSNKKEGNEDESKPAGDDSPGTDASATVEKEIDDMPVESYEEDDIVIDKTG
ncbi:MAG: LysM peptidoglycan-binding domain-containing protein, partial [Pseudomonadota bacterium]